MRRLILAPACFAALVLTGCSTADESPCAADRDCPSGLCELGRCVVTADPSTADARPMDAADGGPDGAAADRGPTSDAQPDAEIDAGRPCADDPPRFARCDGATLRTETCVGGVWRLGPCRAVPPLPCGSVCRGCDPGTPGDFTTERIALRLPPDPLSADDRFIGDWLEELCDGCGPRAEGVVERRRVRQLDADGRVSVEDCYGCAGDIGEVPDTRETWTASAVGYRIEGRALPEGDLTVDRFLLRPDGRIDRFEAGIDDDGQPAAQYIWRYGPTGLWTGLEHTLGDDTPVSHTEVQRDAQGAVSGLIRYPAGAEPERVTTFDLGCWQCDDARCVQGAPPGCTHLPGAVPPLYLCEATCPDGLAPAWLESIFEARFTGRQMRQRPVVFEVGARRVGAQFVWTYSERPVDPLLQPDGMHQRAGLCATITLAANDQLELGAAPCAGAPVLCRAPEIAPEAPEN